MKINFYENKAKINIEGEDICFTSITEKNINDLLDWIVEKKPKNIYDFVEGYDDAYKIDEKKQNPSVKIALVILEEVIKLINNINVK